MKDSPFSPVEQDEILVETGHALAFLDKYPISEGHALVVPKRVVASLYDLEPEEQAAVWEAVAYVREILGERYHPDGFNIGINDGTAAGQTIAHTHIHVIPRYEGDVCDPRGGIRWIMPEKASYWE